MLSISLVHFLGIIQIKKEEEGESSNPVVICHVRTE